MISAKQLQNGYNKLYRCLRNYIWPGEIVVDIADLEVSCYQTFPDLDTIQNTYNKLKYSVFRYIDDDEDMKDAFENFRQTLESSSQLYAKLNSRVQGVE